MSVEYDPYSDAAMRDPFPLYDRLREEAPVFRLEKYDAWALFGFQEVWEASLDARTFSASGGQTPGQVLLGEPVPRSFMTMDPPEHRLHRGLVAPRYARRAVEADKPRLRALTREVVEPLLERGQCDVYGEVASRIVTLNAAHMVGVPRADAERVRGWIDAFMAREPGQVGTSEENARAALELGVYLGELVAETRRSPRSAQGHLAVWLTRKVDGRAMSDEEVVSSLYSMLVTASETTPLAIAGTLYYLAQHPAQREQVLADPSRIPHAFSECLRFDHPTHVLGRRVREPAERWGRDLRPGQGVLLVYASANRDEREFPDAGRFDIRRRPRRSLAFGHGVHKCLGEHLAMALGTVVLEELLSKIGHYEVDESACRRVYGEFLRGYCRVPIRFAPIRSRA